jgi:hypothetical protein
MFSKHSDGLYDVLTVIQHEQQRPVTQYIRQHSQSRAIRVERNAKRSRYGFEYAFRVLQRGEFDQRRAAQALISDIPGHSQRQPSFTDAAGARESEQTRQLEEPPYLRQLTLTPDEAR